MAKDFTAQALALQVKRRGSMPTSQSLFGVSDLVQFMSEEVQSTIAPMITTVREEFYVHIEDVPIVTTQTAYVIPTRGMGNALRDYCLLDSAGNEINLPRLSPEVLKSSVAQGSGRLFGAYFQNEKLVVYPNTDGFSGYSIRFRYLRQPSDLVEKSSASQIIAINPTLKEITVSSAVSTWTTATEFDFIANTSPFVSKGDDRTINSLVTNVLTFDNDLPTDLALGDWVVEAMFSPIPQIPYQGFNWLAQLGVIRSMDALTDEQSLKNAYLAADRMKGDFITMITPRAQGSVQRINNRTGIFTWTGGLGSRRGGTY